MKEEEISIDVSTFKTLLQNAAVFSLNSSSSIPGLQGGKLSFKKEAIEIVTTNLNEFFSASLKIEGNIKEKEVVLDTKKMLEFLGLIEEKKTTLVVGETKIKIKTKEGTAEFGGAPATDYPPVPEPTGKKEKLSRKALEEGLKHVAFAASKDGTRPILSGVRLAKDGKGTVMVATDGFRLSLYRLSSLLPLTDITISAALLTELIKTSAAPEYGVVADEKGLLVGFNTELFQVVTRVIEGSFPAFEKVIPAGFKTRAVVSRQSIIKAMKLAAVFSRDSSATAVFGIGKKQLIISPRAKQADSMVSSIELREFEGEEKNVAFNHRFVTDFLNNTQSENIIIEINEPTSPGVFKTDDKGNFIHVIMPVRVDA